MRNPSLVGALVAAIAVVGLIAACDSEPKPGVGPSSNAQPAQPHVVNTEISGPASIPPGQSAQFTAISRLSDGTSETATSVRWSSHTRLVQVDASGLVTAGQRTGEDVLTAEVSRSGNVGRATKEILVLPDGTYRLAGVVTENVPPATPIVGARVELTGGTSLAATTDWDGRYRLYGVPGTADIRVTRDGYQPHIERLQLAMHGTRNFQLALSSMRLDLAGPYTLAIDVECGITSTPVRPPELRHRSYAAVLSQNGSALEVVMTESSRFRVNGARRGDRFTGRVDAAGATFNLEDLLDFYVYANDPSTYPNVVERVSDGTFLVVNGTAVITGSRAGLSGDLQGFVSHYDSRWPDVPGGRVGGSALGTCYSTAHRFTLTRR